MASGSGAQLALDDLPAIRDRLFRRIQDFGTGFPPLAVRRQPYQLALFLKQQVVIKRMAIHAFTLWPG
jgi:hypothetical protein